MRQYYGLILLALSTSLAAGEWTFTPRFNINETYTSNVLYVENGEEGDFITTLAPGLSVRGEGPRLSSTIDYNLQQRFYFDKTRLDRLNHQLQGDMQATVIKEWLYIDTNSRVSQQPIANRGRVTQDNRGGTGNLQDVVSYEIIPRIEHRLGSWFDVRMEYSRQTVDRSGPGNTGLVSQGSSTENGYRFEVNGGERFGRFPFRFTHESRDVDFDSGQKNEFKSDTGELSYIWSRKFRFTATGGNEDNSFPTSRGQSDGLFWSVGGTWTPSRRTTLSGSWGDRFFGKTFNVSASHRHRRFYFSLDYSEDVRTSNQSERDLALVPLLDVTGEPVFDPVTSSLILVPLDTPSLTDDASVNRRLNVSMNYIMHRSDVSLRFFQNDQEFQRGGNDEKTRGATAAYSRSISPRLSMNLGVTWRENENSGDTSSGSYYRISSGLSYRLGPHTTARLNFEHATNDGGTGDTGGSRFDSGGAGFGGGFGDLDGSRGSQYSENSLSAGLVFDL
ncbi:MAG: TIGR03016 family PEP-CTERM system-associated outer membrane protein [Gammaproteobacteria bacterium]|nr:TIGR03016 family PEP-CTERM system-associated outer membrane protein [Gammaproteobacteria bacterium]